MLREMTLSANANADPNAWVVPLWNLEEEEIFWVDLLNDGTLEL